MKDNKTSALMTIVILAVGSVSGVAAAQFVMGSDGGNINGSIVACIYGACKDNTFNGGTSGAAGGGGGGGGGTGTLTVTKIILDPEQKCAIVGGPQCSPSDFTITVTGTNPSPASFKGSGPPGTTVTLGPGKYTVSEIPSPTVHVDFSDDCQTDASGKTASGTITAGQTLKCTITNQVSGSPP